MTYRFSTILLLTIILVSCQTTPTPVAPVEQKPNISSSENKGLQAVVAHYGGSGHFFKGTTPAVANAPQKTIFEVELSNSTLANDQAHLVDFTTSNMAYLFYKELTAEEKEKYDEIHSVVILSNGEKTTTKFPVADLDAVLKKMKVLDRIVALLKEKNYESLAPMINNTDLVPYDKEELIQNLKSANKDFGDVQSFQPFGFRRKKTNEGERVLHLSGYLVRSIKNNEFSIDLSMDGEKEEVYLLQYVL